MHFSALLSQTKHLSVWGQFCPRMDTHFWILYPVPYVLQGFPLWLMGTQTIPGHVWAVDCSECFLQEVHSQCCIILLCMHSFSTQLQTWEGSCTFPILCLCAGLFSTVLFPVKSNCLHLPKQPAPLPQLKEVAGLHLGFSLSALRSRYSLEVIWGNYWTALVCFPSLRITACSTCYPMSKTIASCIFSFLKAVQDRRVYI